MGEGLERVCERVSERWERASKRWERDWRGCVRGGRGGRGRVRERVRGGREIGEGV